ncbi:MAG: DUF885 domain-containing protein, partial [Pseudomonadota bacterium]|nr:DUF885 domain-containing protein [Pseudomonadota bacterium]
MIRTLLLAAALASALSLAPVVAQAQAQVENAGSPVTSASSIALHRLFEDEWERGLRENPENASYRGDKRYNDRWT